MTNPIEAAAYYEREKAKEQRQTVRDEVIALLDRQTEKGIRKYGQPVDNATGFDWQQMALEELIDCVQYLAKENRELRRRLQDAEKSKAAT